VASSLKSAPREYQPGTGPFISPDPLLTPYDLNAYAYASDNPATDSDPSGAMMITNGGSGGGSIDCSSHPDVVQCPQKSDPQPKGKTTTPSTPGTGSRVICNGTHCASVSYYRAHPLKTAPVTTSGTDRTGNGQASCGTSTGQCNSPHGGPGISGWLKYSGRWALGLLSGFTSLAGAGLSAAEGGLASAGGWMSQAEYDALVDTGVMQGLEEGARHLLVAASRAEIGDGGTAVDPRDFLTFHLDRSTVEGFLGAFDALQPGLESLQEPDRWAISGILDTMREWVA
jgi:hypothetical protein